MQEEVNQKVVSLSIRTGKLTANVLAKAMKMFLDAQKNKSHQYARGKQSLKQLMEQNAGATNIEVDESNIKSFDRVARKYHIDYAVKKDKTMDPPKYFVFFKSRDQDAMTMAFKEFVASNNRKKERPSFKQVLKKFRDRSMSMDKNREREKTRQKGKPPKKSTGKGQTQHKKNDAKKTAQKQSAKTNPLDQALTMVAKKFVKAGGTKLLLKVFPYLLFGYFGNKIAYAYRVTEAPDFFNKLMGSLSNLGVAFEQILPSFHPMDLIIGAVIGVGMRLVVYMKSKNAKKFRKGEEYGSARWGNAKDIEPYMDLENPENNVILTQTEGLIMNGKPKGPKYARNKNILVIGGSGSGKTRFFVKPNLMQLHSSYVITDPKGTVLLEVGQMLYDAGYEIKVLNTINFKKSMHYNPFAYIHSEKDILKLVNTLIVNTKGEGQQATEDFWVKAEKLYHAYRYDQCFGDERGR